MPLLLLSMHNVICMRTERGEKGKKCFLSIGDVMQFLRAMDQSFRGKRETATNNNNK